MSKCLVAHISSCGMSGKYAIGSQMKNHHGGYDSCYCQGDKTHCPLSDRDREDE